jgi:hypothetical protein
MSNILFILALYVISVAKSYKDVKIPEELYLNIKGFIETHSELGFRSVSEFVNASARIEMERIEDRRRQNKP